MTATPSSPSPSRPAGMRRAVALGYDPDEASAPRVLAAGQGLVADRILALAREANVSIFTDPALAAALASVELEHTIPPELYAVVAEILVYVYRVRGRLQA